MTYEQIHAWRQRNLRWRIFRAVAPWLITLGLVLIYAILVGPADLLR